MHLYFSHSHNHVQLWVQVLEKGNETALDWQPALVEEDRLTNTGGVFVLAKVKSMTINLSTYAYMCYVIIMHMYACVYMYLLSVYIDICAVYVCTL